MNKKMKIAVTGATGMLGGQLIRELEGGHTAIPFPSSRELDLADLAAVREFISGQAPDMIVHLAGARDLDPVELDPPLGWNSNYLATHNIALAARESGCALCYSSTDAVFPGEGVFHEYDTPGPISTYGRSKYAGEVVIREKLERYFILRVPWLLGLTGRPERNYLLGVFEKARQGEPIAAAGDQITSACSIRDVARAFAAIIATEHWGTYHVSSEPPASRAGVVKTALEMADYDPALVDEQTRYEMKRPAARAGYTVLRSLLLKPVFGLELPSWKIGLREDIEELKKQGVI